MKRSVFVLFAFLALAAWGHSITGVVTRVSDGDTIWVDRVKVRMDRIDAPESKQAFGREATQFLSDRIKGKEVVVEWKKKDQYGRVLGIVYLGTNDVNLAMIQNGLAWHYKRFDNSQEYASSESRAKASGLGLWKIANPTPPWEFRKYQHLPVSAKTNEIMIDAHGRISSPGIKKTPAE